MRRLLKWIFILLAVIAAGIVLAQSIGRQQPLPERVAILHLTDCKLPCWIGIVPGKTTVGEARRRIREVYADLPGYSVRDDLDADVPSFAVYGGSKLIAVQVMINPERERSSDATVVEHLIIRQPDFYILGAPRLTELYGLLETPSHVIPKSYDNLNYPMLVYNINRLTLAVDSPGIHYDRRCDGPKIVLDSYFTGLYIYAQPPLAQQWSPKPLLWRGFNKCYK